MSLCLGLRFLFRYDDPDPPPAIYVKVKLVVVEVDGVVGGSRSRRLMVGDWDDGEVGWCFIPFRKFERLMIEAIQIQNLISNLLCVLYEDRCAKRWQNKRSFFSEMSQLFHLT